jgi:hypothetical protein
MMNEREFGNAELEAVVAALMGDRAETELITDAFEQGEQGPKPGQEATPEQIRNTANDRSL